MMNLKEMTVTEAVRTAKEFSGKTKKEIADHLGISRGVITRYLQEDDDYSPRMGIIPDLCHALENDILLQWLEVRIRKDRERQKEKMLLHVEKMEKALMGVKALLASKEEISAEDEEELHDLLDKMERECQRLNLLLPGARYYGVSGEKSGDRAEGTKRQIRHERKG
ncbi:hypothetical protein [uncultured Bilophila sp.]|uniref:helix-turn-helix domain-containing protein n=1 Tax=uncultured Bilophila sp. TaxID=529385 RepID=UPI00260E3734|nr:hypothetical protein [uncultured Bilophila sp.]